MTSDRKVLNKFDILVIFCLLFSLVASDGLLRSRVLTDDSTQRISVASPSAFDWRSSTTMTPVKNQADCNAYHAFSTIAFFEQDLILNEGASTNIDLSEQFVTTCMPTGGCIGGSPKDAMEFVLKKGGIPIQSSYPYAPWAIQPQDICYPAKQVSVGTRPMVSYFNLEDQQFLKTLIVKQPLNIYVCSQDLKSYAPKSNSDRTLYCNKDNTYADHTVLLVGYTETEWIIKNSWSTNWGLQGYGYISRNAENDCCIGSQVILRGNQTDNKKCGVENCQVCVENNFCSKCKPGYFVSYQNSSHKCVECNYENCAECENNVGYCKTCIYGYALYFPEQVCKLSVIANCKSIVNGGCKTCHDGYKVTANFTCQNDCKISNCQLCKDDKSCSKCKSGFVLTYANSTLSCIENKCKIQNCASCDAQGKCLSCQGSYTLEEDSCVMKCNKQNCQACSQTQNICAKCNDGMALDFYSHECVTTTVPNCNETYLTKYCSICQDGYTKSDSWEQCNKICAIDNCKTCETGFSNKCTQCKDGYTLKTPSGEVIAICQKNPCNITNCSLCNQAGDTCVQCMDKYHEWNWSTRSCSVYTCQLENCKKCMIGAKKCEECMEGLIPYISNGGCIKSTIDYCAAMGLGNNGTECWDCQSGFSIDFTTWKACKRICKDSNCIDCKDNSQICKTCLSGYALKNVSDSENKCVKIPTYLPNCLRGNSDQTVCYECKQFYFFNEKTGTCDLNGNCPKDCTKCTASNETLKCECKSGFVWDFLNSQCVLNPSDSQCLVISNYTGTPQCFECKDGYTLTQDGKGCQSDCAVQNCDTCVRSEVQNYPDYCQTCNDGYVVNLNLTRCLKCEVDYCKTCAGPNQLSKCTECKTGYELKDDKCEEVPCQKNAVFNGIECACVAEFYKDQSTEECQSCTTSCKRCTSVNQCLECQPGFYLNQESKCSACFQNCEACSNQKTCDACEQGYTYQIKDGSSSCEKVGLGREGYFVLASGKKARCSPGCASCAKSQFSCQQCIKGYILEDEKCIKCSENCQTCYSNVLGACKSCEIGFSLVEGQCKRCGSEACIDCPVQLDICTACLPGYYVKDQTCKSCGIGCKSCSIDGKCESCHTGFALLENGYCEQCLDGCSQCSADALHECKGGCLEGTYKEKEKCLPCSQICTTCESLNKCTDCVPGYELVDGVCRKWCTDWNCFDCSSDSDMCKECYAGYAAVNGKCEQDIACNAENNQNTNTTDNSTTNSTTNSTDNNSTTDTNTTTNTTTPDNTTTNNTTNNTEINTSGQSTTGTCDVCPKKYYLTSNFTCEKCNTEDTNCIACMTNSPSNCTQCAAQYYLTEEGKCDRCADNCYTCRSPQFCYICAAGHFMVQSKMEYSGNCVKCSANCLTCIGTPKNCLSCNKGFVLSVANLCMNQDRIVYKIKLNMPFKLFSEKCRDIRLDVNGMFNNTENTYLMQYQTAVEGSTEMEGYISVSESEKSKGDTFKTLTQSVRGGSYIAGYEILSATLIYDGETYSSQKTNTDDDGVKGWVIAVAVVGGVIGLILCIVLISCIVKKVKANKEDQDSEKRSPSSSGKDTESHLRKENPELK